MAAKKEPELNLDNDVQIIRNILFGDQMGELRNRLAALEETVSAMADQHKQLQKSFEKEVKSLRGEYKSGSKKLNDVEDQVQAESQSLREYLKDQLAAGGQTQEKALEGMSLEVKSDIERLQTDIKNHNDQLSDLVKALAAALVSYKDSTLEAEGD